MFPVGCLVLLLLLDRLESGLVDEVQKAQRRPVPAPVTAIPVRTRTAAMPGMRGRTTDAAVARTAATSAPILRPATEPVELPAVS